jgi:hypothetical protein
MAAKKKKKAAPKAAQKSAQPADANKATTPKARAAQKKKTKKVHHSLVIAVRRMVTASNAFVRHNSFVTSDFCMGSGINRSGASQVNTSRPCPGDVLVSNVSGEFSMHVRARIP